MNSKYNLVLKKSALKFLASQERSVKDQIAAGLEGLLIIPPEGDIKTMQGYDDLFRLRVGTFRILFRIDHTEKIVYVESIGSRGDVYK